MFKKSIFSLALVVLSFNIVFSQSSPTASPNLPLGSVAYSDDIWAIQYNPAGLGSARGWQLYYTHAYSDSSFKGDNGIFMSAGGLGFSAEWLGTQSSAAYRKYSLVSGLKFEDRFFIGSSYSWFGSKNKDLDKLSSWNVGILLRPQEYFSVGFTASNLNRPSYLNQKIDISFNYGAALRPLGDRLTLALEGFSTENQSWKDADVSFKVEAEPTDGLILYGLLDRDKNYGLGVRFNLTNFNFGSFNFFAKKGGLQKGVGYLGFSQDQFRTSAQRKNRLLKMRLAGEIPEENRSGAFLAKKRTLYQVLNQIQKAREDKTVSGLILRIDNLAIGWAKVQELRDALYDFKSSGKKIYAFMESGGNKEYYLATLADKIIMLPTADLNFTGLAAEVTFYKKTLDKLGVVADLEHIGDYKNASDLLTRESMSDAHREVVNSVLDDIYSQILKDIAQARNLTVEEVQAKINQGPFTAAEAKKAGLVDELAFYDEVKEIAEEKENKNFLTLSENVYTRQTDWRYSWFIPPKIALIYATGEIVSGRSGRDFLFGNTMGS
ncbi:MAG TPA: S49 family peptidase, partial [candidate division Zixibacteria bacterium]|nr:S49 family peptidase [candidate division Zixibacteria bacterium]